MPAFKHAPFVARALESVQAQQLADWELIVVDDGSPDETASVVARFLADRRIRFQRHERSQGLGAALNLATSLARGRYLAYLPADDLFYPEHLARLVALLDQRPDAYLAYGGLRWGYNNYGATREHPAGVSTQIPFLAMVQVAHRRSHEPDLRWPTRDELVSDLVEHTFWMQLATRGELVPSDQTTCELIDHADKRHKIIAAPTGGLARYRKHYRIGRGEFLNFQPSRGFRLHEQARYGQFAARRELPRPGGLKILLVGELGFNPERLVALEERGHKLYGLWVEQPEAWDTVGPLAFGNVEDIPLDRNWRDGVRSARPDVIYALLNWQAVSLIGEVLDANLGIPIVFHFKEGPFLCYDKGLWPTLERIMRRSAGQVFISHENREWFELALGGALDREYTLILDGDLPKAEWFADQWAPKLADQDGEIHTACPGRPLGMVPFDAIAAAGIHVHFYGEFFQQNFPNWTREGLATGYMHIHPSVEPSEWVRELSQYDAAWFHVFDSFNKGDLRRAHWDDLNLPARLGTFAAAGLPWILKDNRHSRVAVQDLARQHDIGVFFRDYEDLAAQLRDRGRLAQLDANMRAARHSFTFDAHVDELVGLFQRAIARR